jgi:hypothetical protein
MKPRFLLVVVLLLSLFCVTAATGQPLATQATPAPKASITVPAAELNSIRASLTQIELALAGHARAAELAQIRTTIDAIDKRIKPPDTFFDKLVESYATNLFWEFFGFRKSGSNPIAKVASLLGLLISCIKFFHYLAARRKTTQDSVIAQSWEVFTGLYFVAVTLLLSVLAFSGSGVAEQTAPVRQARDFDGQLERLDKQLASLSANNLVSVQQQLQNVATALQTAPPTVTAGALQDINGQLAALTTGLNAAENRVATHGWQVFQTILLLLIAASGVASVILYLQH